MKIVATSDTHEQTPELPPGDLLIHAGDWSGYGQGHETKAFIKWMSSIKKNYTHGVIAVPGNHERAIEPAQKEFRARFKDAGIRLLVNQETTVEGIKIFGTPYSLPFFNWAYMATDEACRLAFKAIKDDTQIIISHGPPYGIMDECPRNFDWKYPLGSENVGSKALLEVIDRVKPKYCFFGHIHETHGHVTHGSTECYNVAYGYKHAKHYEPIVVEI